MKNLLLTTLLLMACTPTQTKIAAVSNENVKENRVIENSKTYISIDFAKTQLIKDTSTYILIDKPIAIIILPDSTWSNQQQKELGEDGWNEIVADHDYYQSDAMDLLEKNGIEVKFFNTNKQFYKFIKSDKSVYCIDKSKMKDKWGLILFNKDKNPVFWNNTSIEDALKYIYSK
ncbi:MAG: hypothetical protein PHV20_03370 [Bacteroidales bacterium]|nr:hypothetical protein [Bacteroidales bacterium]